MLRTRSKLASSTPAPINSINANATWLVTSTRRIVARPRPCVPRGPSSRITCAMLARRIAITGIMPTPRPTSRDQQQRETDDAGVEADGRCRTAADRSRRTAPPGAPTSRGRCRPGPAGDGEQRSIRSATAASAGRSVAPMRMTRRQLADPRGRSHQHEVGHVDAADQQHEDRAAPQHRQRRAALADQIGPGSPPRRC